MFSREWRPTRDGVRPGRPSLRLVFALFVIQDEPNPDRTPRGVRKCRELEVTGETIAPVIPLRAAGGSR